MSSPDLVITWPKTKRFDDYLHACAGAQMRNEDINYRISKAPNFDFGAHYPRPGRVYVVYDGFVRGYHELKFVIYRDDHEVLAVDGKGYWPAGWYLVRDPAWHEIELIPMKGFQGWRYYS